jgi:hypothetical protein
VGSQVGSHRQPTQGDSESTEVFADWALTRHPATVADASRLVGSRSHRGGQEFKSPQFHPRKCRSAATFKLPLILVGDGTARVAWVATHRELTGIRSFGRSCL